MLHRVTVSSVITKEDATLKTSQRHMDVDTRSLVAERLQQLTEDRISKLLFNSKAYQSLEAIQCLLILSLWAPISGNSESSKRDGRSLIAAAVSMAMNMKLDMASGRLEAASPKGESPRVDGETIELGIRARLVCHVASIRSFAHCLQQWLAVVNTESMSVCTSFNVDGADLRLDFAQGLEEDLWVVAPSQTWS